MPLDLMKHCFAQLVRRGNLQRGSRKLGLEQSGVQNIPVISHFLVEDYLQCCITYRTLVCPCQLRTDNTTVFTFCDLVLSAKWRIAKDTVGKYALKVLQK